MSSSLRRAAVNVSSMAIADAANVRVMQFGGDFFTLPAKSTSWNPAINIGRGWWMPNHSTGTGRRHDAPPKPHESALPSRATAHGTPLVSSATSGATALPHKHHFSVA
jgi:hypothetical protein